MILTSVGTLVSPYVLKIIIDDVFPSQDYSLLINILLILIGINIFRLCINYVSDYLFEWVSNNITCDIRMDLFNHLMRLPISFFHQNKAGDLVHRVNSEINSIQSILTGTVVRLINSLCSIIGLAVMLCILNWPLFLLSMSIMPFVFFNTRYFQPKIQENIKNSREKDSDILSFLMERFSNIKLIKSYVRQNYEQKKLFEKTKEQISLNLKNIRLTGTTRNITMFLTMIVPILILGVGGKQVISGVMTVGALVAFIQYTNRIFDPFRNLMGLYFETIRALVSMQRIFDLFEIRPEETAKKEEEIQKKQNIIFDQVSFAYNNLSVIHDFNFTINYGKKYALVGESGCGKSTLIALLCQFCHPQNGGIFWGKININNISIDTLRNKIALVTQDNQLFHDTILENIRYGNLDSTIKEVVSSASQIGLKNHIERLPRGFETIVGDNGTGLSGGQQQRIAIARAILKNADVIILDEATSALDSDSEKNIINLLCQLYSDKTIIVISHRLSAIRNMDEILCLNRGKIIENGNHEELIIKKGFYWQLFKEQIE